MELSAEIQAIHRESDGTYGAPRVYAELAARGIHVGRKRVTRLMRHAGLQGVSRRKRFRTTVRDDHARPAPDLVDRQFQAAGSDRLWVADITYVPTWAGSYTSPSYSMPGVVGSSAGRWRRISAPSSSWPRSTWRSPSAGRPTSFITRTRATQYTPVAFGKRCREAGVRRSMGSVGDALDNAMCESFFATLECELLDRRRFRTQAEARLAVFDFIEG